MTIGATQPAQQCAFCESYTPVGREAEAGWDASFYIGAVEIDQPVCPGCRHHLRACPATMDHELAHDFGGVVHRYDFSQPDLAGDPEGSGAGTFHFLREPPPEWLDYLASHRRDCLLTHCLCTISYRASEAAGV